jgi:hypothetical protein
MLTARGQAVGEHAAGGTGAYDDVVILGHSVISIGR